MRRQSFKGVACILHVLAAMLISECVTSQTIPSIRFERLNESNGLYNNTITDIAEDQLGFIWIGTEDGLVRYDGRVFDNFRRNTKEINTAACR